MLIGKHSHRAAKIGASKAKPSARRTENERIGCNPYLNSLWGERESWLSEKNFHRDMAG